MNFNRGNIAQALMRALIAVEGETALEPCFQLPHWGIVV